MNPAPHAPHTFASRPHWEPVCAETGTHTPSAQQPVQFAAVQLGAGTTQAPAWHTRSWPQVVVVAAYAQAALVQVPGVAQVFSAVVDSQVAAGAVVQLTPAQGSFTQAPLTHPWAHGVSCGV